MSTIKVEIISNIPNGSLIFLQSVPFHLLALGNHKSDFNPYTFVLSRTSYKWNHRAYSFICIVSLTQCDAFEIPPFLVILFLDVSVFNSFSLLSSILLYQCTTVYLFTTNSWIFCFQFLAIRSKPAIFVGVQVFVWVYVFISLGQVLGILDC